MAYLLKFGAYTFPLGWGVTEDTDELEVPMEQIPRADGAAWLPAIRKARSWKLDGGFVLGALPTGITSVRQAIDALKAGLLSGPQNFQIEDDRFWRNCQAKMVPTKYDKQYSRYAMFSVEIDGPDPYAYETTLTTTAELSSPLAYTLAAGNTAARPAWYLGATAALNTAFSWTWTNTTTGETMDLYGAWPVSGAGYLIVDSLAKKVYSAPSLGGTAGPADGGAPTDAYANFEGQFPTLAQGANAFTLVQTGAAVTGAWATFNGRWK